MSININMNEVETLNNIEKIFMDFINQITLCVCLETETEQNQVTMEEISTNSSSQCPDDNSQCNKNKSKENINDEEWIYLD